MSEVGDHRAALEEAKPSLDLANANARQHTGIGIETESEGLVIEDNEDAPDSLRMLLEIVGYEVRVAHSRPAGLEAVQRHLLFPVQPVVVLPGLPRSTADTAWNRPLDGVASDSSVTTVVEPGGPGIRVAGRPLHFLDRESGSVSGLYRQELLRDDNHAKTDKAILDVTLCGVAARNPGISDRGDT